MMSCMPIILRIMLCRHNIVDPTPKGLDVNYGLRKLVDRFFIKLLSQLATHIFFNLKKAFQKMQCLTCMRKKKV